MGSLYLHIPFCERKCIYCDFYSIENHSSMNDFLRALKMEIEMYRDYSSQETFETVYLGGGTPSLLSSKEVGELLGSLHRTFRIEPGAEITLEVNPGTADKEKLEEYRTAGVNRLSVGVQSFHDDDLNFLGRIHSADEAKNCIRRAQQAGFESISIDLIYALPRQTMDRWKNNLERAVESGARHISAYSLIIEDDTPLARTVKAKQVKPLPAELEADMYEYTMAYLTGCGFEHYEVSNYGQPGFRSRHNSNYWNHTNYLGFGPSAHSFWSMAQPGQDRRWWNVRSVQKYCKKVFSGGFPLAGEESLTGRQITEETIMLSLRSNGIDLHRFKGRHGVDFFKEGRPIIEQLIAGGLANLKDSRLRLTDKGFLLCDEICERFLSFPCTP